MNTEDIRFYEFVRGASAYEVAVRNGFEGTQEEWLESLKGGTGAGTPVELDKTLTAEGKAADAKAVGEALDTKQPKGEYLTEHQQLKTINGKSIVGQGNIVIAGDGALPAPTNLRKLYYGYDFTDCTAETGIEWYYTPSERENMTIGSVTYDCPTAGTNTYGYAIANPEALASIRNKPIDRVRFRLSPDETATSGVMKFAVMPINGATYTRYIEAEFTAQDIVNSWVTIALDEAFTIGDNETFVIQPVDNSHSASDIGIAILRASVATTTDKYINTYYNVPVSWTNGGNYITRLGLCVDLGYSAGNGNAMYVPNFDEGALKGGWTNNNLTANGYAPSIGFSNAVQIKKYYVCDDICTKSLVKLSAMDAVLAFGSAVRTDGAGGRSVGSLIKFDFKNKKLIICKKNRWHNRYSCICIC